MSVVILVHIYRDLQAEFKKKSKILKRKELFVKFNRKRGHRKDLIYQSVTIRVIVIIIIVQIQGMAATGAMYHKVSRISVALRLFSSVLIRTKTTDVLRNNCCQQMLIFVYF